MDAGWQGYRKEVVALRKESVDRNSPSDIRRFALRESLSARRAWIEILPGSVSSEILQSLSARRAWIEILTCTETVSKTTDVALRKESVDRNRCPAWA